MRFYIFSILFLFCSVLTAQTSAIQTYHKKTLAGEEYLFIEANQAKLDFVIERPSVLISKV